MLVGTLADAAMFAEALLPTMLNLKMQSCRLRSRLLLFVLLVVQRLLRLQLLMLSQWLRWGLCMERVRVLVMSGSERLHQDEPRAAHAARR
tara:strand:- start:180 stop:452 length:273 start_codon:yes stop_codon:yes gene_type:complete